MAAERNSGYRLGWTAHPEEKAYVRAWSACSNPILKQTTGEHYHNRKITESPQPFCDSVIFPTVVIFPTNSV